MATAKKDEQPKDLAGKKPRETSGSAIKGTVKENKPSDNAPKDQWPVAAKEKEGSEVNCNLFHDGVEYCEGQIVSPNEKIFAGLKKLGFLK